MKFFETFSLTIIDKDSHKFVFTIHAVTSALNLIIDYESLFRPSKKVRY